MRLDIRYVTRFDYAKSVRESHNEVRACPTTSDRQQLVSYRLVVSPAARVLSATDYWGTRVDAFGVREPHEYLEVVAEAAVETSRVPWLTASPRRDELTDPVFLDAHAEYLGPSHHAAWGPAVAAEARRRSDDVGDDVIGVVLALHRTVGTTMRYTPGATYIGVPVDDVLECREGVCQDFAHLMIALCRSIGIPARYVSGYFFTLDDATGADPDALGLGGDDGAGSDGVEVQTHAWVEVAVPGAGWWPLDPTNRQEVGERHVKIGHGRDYDDVPPMRGVYSGQATHKLEARVHMRRATAAQQQQQ